MNPTESTVPLRAASVSLTLPEAAIVSDSQTALPRRRATDNEVILIVDDSPENLSALGSLLQEAGYRVKVANSGGVGLRLAVQPQKPSLILLDIMMQDMNGHEVLHYLRHNPETRDIPVIFLTAKDSDEDEERAFNAGIADYITKPFKPSLVLARVRSQLLVRRARMWLQDQNHSLEAEVARRMRENELIQAASIHALAHLAETRDNETGNHIARTQSYVRLLATRLTNHPRFRGILTPTYIETVARSAPLHDIGKVAVGNEILEKPGRLTEDEFAVMKHHAAYTYYILSDIDDFDEIRDWAAFHHERLDGTGYPFGKTAAELNTQERMMACIDIYQALTESRPYKQGMPHEKACEILWDMANKGWLDETIVKQVEDCFRG